MAQTLTTAKTVEVIFEKAIETYKHQTKMADMVEVFTPEPAALQNAGNNLWRPAQQHAPVFTGWDVTGQYTGIIEETYRATLTDPRNDAWEIRADDLRDMTFWERRGEQSGMRQASELNRRLAALVANEGSLFVQAPNTTTNGFDFVSYAQVLLDERQNPEDMRYFLMNPRANRTFASDLSGRETLRGRPEMSYAMGQIGANVAGFDVYSGNFLPQLTGGASPDTTTTAAVSLAPVAGTTTTTGSTNVDYRYGTIPVTASASYAVGDKVRFDNSGTAVQSLGKGDKTPTGQAMTFTITSIPSGTSVVVSPRPIAVNDGSLTSLQQAYANINTQIASGATMVRLNTEATATTNIFWQKGSIEVFGGDAPIDLLNSFAGQRVISSSIGQGQKMYMAYDGNIDDMSFKCRIFTWYGLTNKDPSQNGVLTLAA